MLTLNNTILLIIDVQERLAPVMLAGNLRKVSRQTYALQVDPPRERAIAVWVKEG